jgi:hypothetical protein
VVIVGGCWRLLAVVGGCCLSCNYGCHWLIGVCGVLSIVVVVG